MNTNQISGMIQNICSPIPVIGCRADVWIAMGLVGTVASYFFYNRWIAPRPTAPIQSVAPKEINPGSVDHSALQIRTQVVSEKSSPPESSSSQSAPRLDSVPTDVEEENKKAVDFLQKSEAHLASKNYDGAIQCAEDGIRSNPSDVFLVEKLYLIMIAAYGKLGNTTYELIFLDRLNEILRSHRQTEGIHYEIQSSSPTQDPFTQIMKTWRKPPIEPTIEKVKRFLETSNDTAQKAFVAHIGLILLREAGRSQEADAFIKLALEFCKHHPKLEPFIIKEQMLHYLDTKNFLLAQSLAKLILQSNHFDPEINSSAHKTLGIIDIVSKKNALAIQHFENALKLNHIPVINLQYFSFLVQLHNINNDWDSFLKLWDRFELLVKNLPSVLNESEQSRLLTILHCFAKARNKKQEFSKVVELVGYTKLASLDLSSKVTLFSQIADAHIQLKQFQQGYDLLKDSFNRIHNEEEVLCNPDDLLLYLSCFAKICMELQKFKMAKIATQFGLTLRPQDPQFTQMSQILQKFV